MLPASLFTGAEVHARDVELADGETHRLYFRECSASVFRKFFEASESKDDETRYAAHAHLIVGSLCEPDGKPALTLEQAINLKMGVQAALMKVIYEVNGMASGKASPPAVKNGSGTSSRSPSAATRSRSGKRG
jgi:hypothetical protein